MSTVVIVSTEASGSSVCFCSAGAVTFTCSPRALRKLSQHQITPKTFKTKLLHNLIGKIIYLVTTMRRSSVKPVLSASLRTDFTSPAGPQTCTEALPGPFEVQGTASGADWMTFFFFFFLHSHQTSTTPSSSGNMRKKQNLKAFGIKVIIT